LKVGLGAINLGAEAGFARARHASIDVIDFLLEPAGTNSMITLAFDFWMLEFR
jgi:hypothetical protein